MINSGRRLWVSVLAAMAVLGHGQMFTVTRSRPSSSSCTTTHNGLCITDGSGNYGNNERCTYVYHGHTTTVTAVEFRMGCDRRRVRRDDCDTFRIGGSTFTSRVGSTRTITDGTSLTFTADDEDTSAGYTFCVSSVAPTTAPSAAPSDAPSNAPTALPTSGRPTTAAPSTAMPTTASPTTASPTASTAAPTTASPTASTTAPTAASASPVTPSPSTSAPTSPTPAPTTATPTSQPTVAPSPATNAPAVATSSPATPLTTEATNTESATNDGAGGGGGGVDVVAVIAGVVLALLLAVTVVVLLKRRQRKDPPQKYVVPTANPVFARGVTNAAYVSGRRNPGGAASPRGVANAAYVSGRRASGGAAAADSAADTEMYLVPQTCNPDYLAPTDKEKAQEDYLVPQTLNPEYGRSSARQGAGQQRMPRRAYNQPSPNIYAETVPTSPQEVYAAPDVDYEC